LKAKTKEESFAMKKTDFSKRMKKKVLPMLKAIFPTAILTFICYAFLSQFIGAGKLDGYYSQFAANLGASVAEAVLYALWFHWFYTTASNKIYVLHVQKDQPFHFLKEGKAFLKEEGLPFLAIYAIFTALFEAIALTAFLAGNRLHWALVYVAGAVFPLRIADSTICFLLSPVTSIPFLVILITFFALLSRKRLHKKLSKQ